MNKTFVVILGYFFLTEIKIRIICEYFREGKALPHPDILLEIAKKLMVIV
jgi:hypothetical protein